MAPELLTGGDESYEGPPVDCFAVGVMLFIMCYGKFPFSEANDVYYRRMHKDPVKAMNVRKINASPDFLDLVVGLTTPDPSKRYTMAQVKSHEWFEGPTASPEELKEYFYSLQHDAKANDAAHYEEMQGKRSHFAQTSLVERGAGEEVCGPDPSEVEAWDELKYKVFKPSVSGTTGFYCNTIAQHLFIALWEFLGSRKYPTTPEVDPAFWKMNFSLDEPILDDLEPESDEDEEDMKMPTVEVDIVALVEDRGAEMKPRYFMSFRRKEGDAALFSKFVKEAMSEKLEMFVEKI